MNPGMIYPYLLLILVFVVGNLIMTCFLWKRIPKSSESYQKVAEEYYDEICCLKDQVIWKDKEIQRLNDGFRIVKAKAVEIKNQVEGEVLKYVSKTKCPYGIHQFIGSLACMDCEYYSENLGNYTMICLYKVKNQKLPDKILVVDERNKEL